MKSSYRFSLYGLGESDVGTSGSSIENVERLKDCFSRSVSELKCKQSVVSRINSMQEEEIAHLENMLKEEQMHRCNVAKEMKFLQQVKEKEASIASKRQEVSELEEPGSVPDAGAVAQGEVRKILIFRTSDFIFLDLNREVFQFLIISKVGEGGFRLIWFDNYFDNSTFFQFN